MVFTWTKMIIQTLPPLNEVSTKSQQAPHSKPTAPFVRGTTDKNHLPWPGMIVTTCVSYLTTGGAGKEHGTDELPPTERIQERSKGEGRFQSICPTNFPESFSLEFILAEQCTPPERTLSQNDWPETTWKLTPLP